MFPLVISRRLTTRRLCLGSDPERNGVPPAHREHARLRDRLHVATGRLGRFGGELGKGDLDPVVERVLPLERAADAHRAMKAFDLVRSARRT